MFLLQKLSKLVENITCFTFSQLHTFQPIWLGLEIVDKGENKASVLDVLSRHTAELCGATSLKRTLCWASFLFNNFNQIHQQGKKCERRWEKWVCIEELKQFILLRTGRYSPTVYAMIISAFKKIRHYFMFAIESRYMNVSAVSESWIWQRRNP